MAELVGAFAASHGPLIVREWDNVPAEDQQRFVADVTKVTESILAGQPLVKAEYDALREAAQRHRK